MTRALTDHLARMARWNAIDRATGICRARGLDHTAPATYVWHLGPGRSELPICVECCARWRECSTDPEWPIEPPHKITIL